MLNSYKKKLNSQPDTKEFLNNRLKSLKGSQRKLERSLDSYDTEVQGALLEDNSELIAVFTIFFTECLVELDACISLYLNVMATINELFEQLNMQSETSLNKAYQLADYGARNTGMALVANAQQESDRINQLCDEKENDTAAICLLVANQVLTLFKKYGEYINSDSYLKLQVSLYVIGKKIPTNPPIKTEVALEGRHFYEDVLRCFKAHDSNKYWLDHVGEQDAIHEEIKTIKEKLPKAKSSLRKAEKELSKELSNKENFAQPKLDLLQKEKDDCSRELRSLGPLSFNKKKRLLKELEDIDSRLPALAEKASQEKDRYEIHLKRLKQLPPQIDDDSLKIKELEIKLEGCKNKLDNPTGFSEEKFEVFMSSRSR